MSFAVFAALLIAQCDEPDDVVTVRDGEVPLVVVMTHAGKKQPVSCATQEPLERRECLPELDVVCESGPCRTTFDLYLRTVGNAFIAHIGACLGGKPTVMIAETKRPFVDMNRDVDDAGGPLCAVGSNAAIPYWRAFYAKLDDVIAHARNEFGDRALLVELHTYKTLDAAPPPALILGTGRPFGQTLPTFQKNDPHMLQWFGPRGLRAALKLRFPDAEVWPRAKDELDEELFAGRHLVLHAGTRIDALQFEFSSQLREESELAGFLAADAFCEIFAPRLQR